MAMCCSPAELTSVSIERFKFQFNQLYLQPVEKSNHLPVHKYTSFTLREQKNIYERFVHDQRIKLYLQTVEIPNHFHWG